MNNFTLFHQKNKALLKHFQAIYSINNLSCKNLQKYAVSIYIFIRILSKKLESIKYKNNSTTINYYLRVKLRKKRLYITSINNY